VQLGEDPSCKAARKASQTSAFKNSSVGTPRLRTLDLVAEKVMVNECLVQCLVLCLFLVLRWRLRAGSLINFSTYT